MEDTAAFAGAAAGCAGAGAPAGDDGTIDGAPTAPDADGAGEASESGWSFSVKRTPRFAFSSTVRCQSSWSREIALSPA